MFTGVVRIIPNYFYVLLAASGPHVSFEYFLITFHISNTNTILIKKKTSEKELLGRFGVDGRGV